MIYERVVAITSPHYEKVLYVPNACDYDHFSKATEPDPKVGDVIGYIGVIYEGLNQKVLRALAEKYKVLLIGEQKCEIEKHPNIYCAGHIHYDNLPGIMSQIKVCIRPINIEKNYTLYQGPVKVFEYAAGGRPIVTSPIPELEPLAEQGLIKLVPTDDVDGWVKAVDEAVKEYPNKDGQIWAKKQTWDRRWQQIKEAIGLK
jgi:glycosyltransferase involved in cell wall biosynthesis